MPQLHKTWAEVEAELAAKEAEAPDVCLYHELSAGSSDVCLYHELSAGEDERAVACFELESKPAA